MSLLSRLMIACVLLGSLPHAGYAEFVTTESAMNAEQREVSTQRINQFLLRSDVQAELIRLGVQPEQALARVASLTASELQELESRIGDAPAGGIAEVVGIVAIVLIVLELLGVTNVFTNF